MKRTNDPGFYSLEDGRAEHSVQQLNSPCRCGCPRGKTLSGTHDRDPGQTLEEPYEWDLFY